MTVLDLFDFAEPEVADPVKDPGDGTTPKALRPTFVMQGEGLVGDPFTCEKCGESSTRFVLFPGPFLNAHLCGGCRLKVR